MFIHAATVLRSTSIRDLLSPFSHLTALFRNLLRFLLVAFFFSAAGFRAAGFWVVGFWAAGSEVTGLSVVGLWAAGFSLRPSPGSSPLPSSRSREGGPACSSIVALIGTSPDSAVSRAAASFSAAPANFGPAS